jgi:hypothetical protein
MLLVSGCWTLSVSKSVSVDSPFWKVCARRSEKNPPLYQPAQSDMEKENDESEKSSSNSTSNVMFSKQKTLTDGERDPDGCKTKGNAADTRSLTVVFFCFHNISFRPSLSLYIYVQWMSLRQHRAFISLMGMSYIYIVHTRRVEDIVSQKGYTHSREKTEENKKGTKS